LAGAGRKGRYWADEVVVNNAVRPWWGTLVLFAAKPGGGGGGSDLYRTDSRTAFLAQALQSFTYDYDGNLTSDGVWDYGYDAENRLIWMETNSNALTYSFPHRVLQFKYDYAGRRVQKRVINGATSAEISSRRYLYDGWNLVAEYEAPSGTSLGSIVRSYTWGLDIVSSLGGAGGVGALLQITDHGSGKTFLPTYDGNGNVVALLNGSTGAVGATYEYSPFGETVRAQVADSVLAEQPFRFSTKFTDLETGLVYYGLRYYEPKNGRFINRDPMGEGGGLNLYGFCGNNGVNRWDLLGLVENGNYEVVQDEYGWMSTAVDASGNKGEWRFGNEIDANNWGAAWVHYRLDTVGARLVLTEEYIAAAEAHNNPTPAPAPRDYGISGDVVFVSAGITYTFIGVNSGTDAMFDYLDSVGNISSQYNNYYQGPEDDPGGEEGGMIGGLGTFTAIVDGVVLGTMDRDAVTVSQIAAHQQGGVASAPTAAPNSAGIASSGDGMYSDGSIPYVTRGGEAGAVGRNGVPATITLANQNAINAPGGKLTLAQANDHYRNGGGVPIQVDAQQYDFSAVNPNGFVNGRQPYTFPSKTSADFLVNGTITLQLGSGGQTFRVLNDRYDFDMHSWTAQPFRNLATLGANVIANPTGSSSAQPFDIIFRGNLPLPPPRK